MPTYSTIVTVDEAFRLAGSPSQDPDADTYFPLIEGGSIEGYGELKAGIQTIIDRHVARFEATIEQYLQEKQAFAVVAHLTEVHTLSVVPNYNKPGLAGCELPDEVVAYVYDAYHSEDMSGNAMSYDGALDRKVGRSIPGVDEFLVRVRGRDVEVYPNREAAVYCYLVTRQRAIEGAMPAASADINNAIVKEIRDAIRFTVQSRQQFRRQEKEVAP